MRYRFDEHENYGSDGTTDLSKVSSGTIDVSGHEFISILAANCNHNIIGTFSVELSY
jgi:hypothetical protein